MPNQRFATLEEWLQWQETLHPSAIDLGLERVRAVYQALDLPPPARLVTVAGTNGKGSCVTFLQKLFTAAGYRVGSYTSPHLLSYNERVRVNGQCVADQSFIDAFTAIDQARGEHSLTYFEFGTLAAFYIFAQHDLDLVLLEVGMGGRLDATNILDADISLVTSIGLDHQAWLGDTREAIALEKAGVMRSGRPAVCAEFDVPSSLLNYAEQHGVPLLRAGNDFDFETNEGTWLWQGQRQQYDALPLPAVSVPAYLGNFAAALQVAELLQAELPYPKKAVEQACREAVIPGRCYLFRSQPEVWLDVAHNPDACEVLAVHLATLPAKKTHLVFAVLDDKAVGQMLMALQPYIDHLHLTAPHCQRALSLPALKQSLPDALLDKQVSEYPTVEGALTELMDQIGSDERIIVTGSFYTVAEAMAIG